jgi:hypothetical protein
MAMGCTNPLWPWGVDMRPSIYALCTNKHYKTHPPLGIKQDANGEVGTRADCGPTTQGRVFLNMGG